MARWRARRCAPIDIYILCTYTYVYISLYISLYTNNVQVYDLVNSEKLHTGSVIQNGKHVACWRSCAPAHDDSNDTLWRFHVLRNQILRTLSAPELKLKPGA